MSPKLFVREHQSKDIPVIISYWMSLTPGDYQRMSIDPTKMSTREEFTERLTKLLAIKGSDRQVDPLIWTVDGEMVGFTNLNNFQRPEQADIHLHMVSTSMRGKGLGRQLFKMSVQEYFRRHQIKKIVCQPSATNPAPNKMMTALGIPVVKTYRTLPSVISYEHEVNRYELFPGI